MDAEHHDLSVGSPVKKDFEKMSEVFILGAGFSKAISDRMPLTKDLSRLVLENCQHASITPSIHRMIEEDFEKALTFLAQDKPWLSESENLRLKALYLDLTDCIRRVVHDLSKGAEVWGSNRPPLWLEALITYWHNNRCAVITLNYDTLIERVASSVYWLGRPAAIPTGHLYPIYLTPAAKRGSTTFGNPIEAEALPDTFGLFKLHGSTNWFFSGRSDFFGEELYYVPCMGGLDGAFDAWEGSDPEKLHWTHLSDKRALIIPPTLDKSMFFQHESLRSMWFQAGQAIHRARRIVCMGYSLPLSDLTMAQFLRSSAPPTPIPFEIVDVTSKREHFAGVLGETGFNFKQADSDLNAVPKFVVNRCIPNQGDKFHVIRMTIWKQTETEPPDAADFSEQATHPLVPGPEPDKGNGIVSK